MSSSSVTRSTPNRLAAETSPYLLQHAGNPVDWYPWGEEAFARARSEGKPIFLSIGYSTCHWCHVMERESFENDEVARRMNESFVNIKVDREERPDVDRVYMAFVQATTGSGGWPMSVFLTPQLEPFFGGTYFPPDDRYGRPGFSSILGKIAEMWRSQRDAVATAGRRVMEDMRRAEEPDSPVVLGDQTFVRADKIFAQAFDEEHGGFGRAPKFPRPVVHNYLLRRFARAKDDLSLKMVLGTLHLMSRGGMYDHLGGGYHRYSVDQFWHVPHFEKMLYEQAQLDVSLVEMVQITGDAFLAAVARETCDYVVRDLAHPDGGLYSAEDADSLTSRAPGAEKVEGAFYVWTAGEIDALLGADAALFAAVYAIETDGNAEDPQGELAGKNVLHAILTVAQAGEKLGIPVDEVERRLASSRSLLFAVRAGRPRPHLDDKVLTAWNGMMVGALARASQILAEPRYLDGARRAAGFLREHLVDKKTTPPTLRRRWRDGEAAFDAYLDDYAALASGLIDLYEAGFDTADLELAEQLADAMVAQFHDPEAGGFFSTSGKDPSVLLRMKEDYDGAEPSGNSTAALTLLRLADILDREDFRKDRRGDLPRVLAAARRVAARHAADAVRTRLVDARLGADRDRRRARRRNDPRIPRRGRREILARPRRHPRRRGDPRPPGRALAVAGRDDSRRWPAGGLCLPRSRLRAASHDRGRPGQPAPRSQAARVMHQRPQVAGTAGPPLGERLRVGRHPIRQGLVERLHRGDLGGSGTWPTSERFSARSPDRRRAGARARRHNFAITGHDRGLLSHPERQGLKRPRRIRAAQPALAIVERERIERTPVPGRLDRPQACTVGTVTLPAPHREVKDASARAIGGGVGGLGGDREHRQRRAREPRRHAHDGERE